MAGTGSVLAGRGRVLWQIVEADSSGREKQRHLRERQAVMPGKGRLLWQGNAGYSASEIQGVLAGTGKLP